MKLKFYLMVFGLVAILLLGIIFGMYPTITSYSALNDELASQNLNKNQLTAKIKNITDLKSTYDKLSPYLGEFSYAYPETKDLPSVIANLSQIALSNNFVIDAIDVRDNIAADPIYYQGGAVLGGIESIVVEISVEYDNGKLKPFLLQLEQYPRVLNLKQLTLITNTEKRSTLYRPNIANLQIVIYYKSS